jgi:GT2 family glycosyltransferase
MQPVRPKLLYGGLWLAEVIGSRLRAHRSAAKPPLRSYNPGLTVIIPERANPVILAECLKRATAACGTLSERFEVIVVVSGSKPSTYHTLMDKHQQVRWLFSERPLWYSGAIRVGLAAARFDWVYLLNSDMMLDPMALESILKLRSPKVFSIASQVFFRDPSRRREETGWTLFRSTGGPIEILDEVPDDDVTVRGTFYAGGGAGLFRRCLLLDLTHSTSSVYDPFYWEDVEWGARAWRLGYASLYCPSSKAWHLHRMTNRLFFPETEINRILTRNSLVFHFRNGPSPAPFRHFLEPLVRLDERSCSEIFGFHRMAQIVLGRYQSCRLPNDHIALDRTWQMRYGLVDQWLADH